MIDDTELTVIVTDKDGVTKTLGSASGDPGDRPQGLQFGTQAGSGFYTGSFTLSWPIDRDREDIHLLDDVKIVSANGDIAYEGFVAAMPRSKDESSHTLTISLAGYMATAAGLDFTMPFVDRDLSNWSGPRTSRRAFLLGAGWGQIEDPSVLPDESQHALTTAFTGSWAAGATPICEAWYDAGPNTRIGRILASWTRGPNVSATPDPMIWDVLLSSDDMQTVVDGSGDLQAAGPASTSVTAGGPRRYALLRLLYTAGPAGTDGATYNVDWRDVAVIGAHGLPLIGNTPQGVAASDVIRWVVDHYCPLLSSAGVQATTYPIRHLVFRDRTKPYDAMLKVNSYHLWDLAVWENRTLHYSPVDLTDWDYEIHHDEAGNTIGLQGDEYTALRNAIVVQFPNVQTGAIDELLPADYPQLRDDSIDNPFNQHGWDWTGDPYVIPFPTTLDNALELGRIRLLEDNQPKAPGSFTRDWHITDRQGNPQPVWKVRTGCRVRVTSSANLSDRPRLVRETQYSHDGRRVTIAVDSILRFLEGYIDRTQTSLQAAGLT